MFIMLSILQVICVILSFFITVSILNYQTNSNEYKLLLTGMIYVFVYNLSCIFEIGCEGEEAALFIFQIKAIAICHALFLMFLFIVKYYNLKLTKGIEALLIIVNIVVVTGAMTCQTNRWFFKKIEFVKTGPYPHLEFENGVGAYGYYGMIFLLGVIINFVTFKNSMENRKGKRGKREIYLFISTIVPLLSFFFYYYLFKPYNPMPIALFISGVFLMTGTYKYQLFDVIENVKDRMIDTMKEAIIIVDSQGGFLHANKTAKQIFKDLQAKKKEEKLSDLIDLDNIVEDYPQEFVYNNCYYECSTTIVRNKDEIEGYAFCIADVTQRREYMEDLIRMKEKADEANHAKSAFLANMSHDLRTPMNAIIGMCQIAVRKEKEAKQKELLSEIEYSAQSLLGLINNILDFSKIEAGKLVLKKEKYDMSELIHEVSAMIYILLMGKPIEFYVNIKTKIPKFLIGDGIRIREIIMNLLGNATKFTKDGEINLNISWEEFSEEENLTIQVSDTGIGMRQENLDVIFEEYGQIREESEKARGTGLGLSIVKELAELMNGTVQVESTYGMGSVFTVIVSQEKEKECEMIGKKQYTKKTIGELKKKGKEREEQLKFPGRRVLVVDDVLMNLKVMQGLLEPYDICVATATNGKKAIELMKSQLFDLVFMDSRMPEMNGAEVVEIIRRERGNYFKDLPIIMMSAEGNYGEAKKYTKYGFTSNLAKPVQIEELEQIMMEWFLETMLDMRSGIRQTGGRKEQYIRILETYMEEIGKLKDELSDIWKEDRDLFNVKIHGIKGSSWNIGAINIGNEAELIESRAKEGETEFVENNLKLFIQNLEHLLEKIDEVIVRENEIERKDKGIGRKESELYQLILQFKEAFANYDIEKLELLVNELETWEADENLEPFILELKKLIYELEYERGEAFVSQWIEKNIKIKKNC